MASLSRHRFFLFKGGIRMICFNCGEENMRTEYPIMDEIQYVRKKCMTCGYKSYPTAVMRIDS